MPIAAELTIILVLLLANGLFAMSEMAIVSSRKARLAQRAEEGDERARAALALAEDPDDFLSTVQIGITLVGILAGAFGGATLAEELGPLVARIEPLARYSNTIAFVLVVGTITYLSLVIGELVPKRLALANPESIAMHAAGPMRGLSRVVSPVVTLLSASSDLLMRILPLRPSAEPAVTEEEIRVLIEQGARAGVLSRTESDVVQSVFRLGERRVGPLMTHRTDIVWLDLHETMDTMRAKIGASGYSRFPVCDGGLDDVVGIVEAKALLVRSLAGHPMDNSNELSAVLTEAMRPPQFVPESSPAVELLELFQQSSLHLALVVDEYGGIQGLVTLHDILNAVSGDVMTGVQTDAPRAIRRSDGSWLLDGMISIDDFRDLLRLRELPGEEDGTFETLGGFVMSHLGRIPEVADRFEWAGLRFEVLDMDGRRVDKVLVMPAPGDVETGE